MKLIKRIKTLGLAAVMASGLLLSSLSGITASADSVNSVQTAEPISLTETKSVTFKYGEFYDDWYFESGKYYSFVAPYTGYFNFTLTGWKSQTDGTTNASVNVTDSLGKSVDYGGYYNQYYNDVKSVAECIKGQIYYIELWYTPYDTPEYEASGNATTSINLTITPHAHDFDIEVYSFATYYNCKRCLHSYSEATKTTAPTTADNNKAAQVAQAKATAQKIMNQTKITKLMAKSKAKKKITVTWKKTNEAVGYEVQVSNKKKYKKILVDKFTPKVKLTIRGNKIKSKKTYYVRVRAYCTYKDAKGTTQKVYSSWNKQLRKVKVK